MGLKNVHVPRGADDHAVNPSFREVQDAINQLHELTAEYCVSVSLGSSQLTAGPFSLSSNQNDFSPVGWDAATYVFLAPTTSVVITGLAATSVAKRKTIIHVGTDEKTLGFYEESGLSAPANRIRTPHPNDVYLLKNWAVEIWYDDSISRWRFI